jgi:hypothetical protein
MPFEAGKTEGANREGQPKSAKLMRDAITLALHREATDANGQKTKKLYQLADALVDKAIAGDVAAAKEIADRVDGKAVQPVSGEDGGPVQHSIKLAWLTEAEAKARGLG